MKVNVNFLSFNCISEGLEMSFTSSRMVGDDGVGFRTKIVSWNGIGKIFWQSLNFTSKKISIKRNYLPSKVFR